MKTRLILLSAITFLILPCMVMGKGISAGTAFLVARNFCVVHGFQGDILAYAGTGALEFQVNAENPDGIRLFYRFQSVNHAGFILIAADDRIPPVLGYSFDQDLPDINPPPAFTAFIQDMKSQILWAINHDVQATTKTLQQWKHIQSSHIIPDRGVKEKLPMISSKWAQGCFYNAGCPNDTASHTTCLHVPAGSGAIAMAQIMKFYQYPAHGNGEHGYTHPKYGIQYANFGATNYNWSGMPDSLTAGCDDLTTLIYQCGVAQNMNFGTLASSSQSDNIDSAFVKYFSYPKTATWKRKFDFTTSEWLTQLKNELDSSHPVPYTGYTSTSQFQHYFVCDGYQGDDFFHFNWGWGGAYDGYFYLNSLNPDTLNYTFAQSAIFNLAPSITPPSSYIMNFENVPDFSLTFNDWTVNDVDKHDTYFINNHTFPHSGAPMAFISFNPAQVTPSMASNPAIQPHGGQRFGACFSSNPPSNNDWFISPQVQLGVNGSFSFWIKSYDNDFGVDDYMVAVSTTDNNPASFISVPGSDTLHSTTIWTKKTFNLNNFSNQKVYVAIHCVSNDHLLMMIDDLEVKPQASAEVVADFSADKTTVRVGEAVNFTDLSSGEPTSWMWTFTGATQPLSSLQNPTGIKYSTPGKYPVKLKVSNSLSSDSITKAAYVEVTGYPSSMSLDFESLSDFTLLFNSWTVIDVKGGFTYGINQPGGAPYVFPHSNDPMAYICFNPSKTVPVITSLQPHSGQKLGCCFSTIPTTPPALPLTPNDKWLISPKMSLGINPQIEFWVRTYNPFYGDEKYNLAVSVTDLNPSSFIALKDLPESAPDIWTKRTYDLSNYTNPDVYIGIQCITDNGFIFMLDDISITSTVGIVHKTQPLQLAVFPNPAKDRVTLKFGEVRSMKLDISLSNTLGTELRSWYEFSSSGTLTLDIHDVPAGVYILRINHGTEEMIQKISIIN